MNSYINKGKKEEKRLRLFTKNILNMKVTLGMGERRKPLPWFIRWLGPIINSYYDKENKGKQLKLKNKVHLNFLHLTSFYLLRQMKERIQNLTKLI